MIYQQQLRVQLQQRRNRLYKAVMDTYVNELKYLLAFIDATSYLSSIVRELAASFPGIDWPAWREKHFDGRSFALPDVEQVAAKVCYGLITESAAATDPPWQYGMLVNNEGNLNAALRDFTEVFVDPFVNYLHDRLDEGSNTLALVEKYKRRTEWFHKDDLLDRITWDPKQSETVADTDLREYLFDQGIDYPFSSPRSPSGRADVVADVGDERPLVLEVKLFDPDRGYDRSYVRKGFRQIHDYANDYGQSTGYLVVFNCSAQPLVFKTRLETTMWPPRVEFNHVTYFLVVIDLGKKVASRRGSLEPYVIDEAYLTEDAAAPAAPGPG